MTALIYGDGLISTALSEDENLAALISGDGLISAALSEDDSLTGLMHGVLIAAYTIGGVRFKITQINQKIFRVIKN
jgi:hypothetical protein